MAPRAAGPGAEPVSTKHRGAWRHSAGDRAAAEVWAGRGYDQLASFGDHAHASTQAIFRGVSCYLLGRFDEARRYAAAGREMSASDDAINQYSWRSVEAKLLTRRAGSTTPSA
mgnify:CR=1 FL=1